MSLCIDLSFQLAFHEFAREPVEQFRVRRPLAAKAEVARGRDDALAEMMLPEPIDDHARRQRIVLRRDPVRQCEPPAGAVGHRRDRRVRGLAAGRDNRGEAGNTSAPWLASSPRSSRYVFGGAPGLSVRPIATGAGGGFLDSKPAMKLFSNFSFALSSSVSSLGDLRVGHDEQRAVSCDQFLLPAGALVRGPCGARPALLVRAWRASLRRASRDAALRPRAICSKMSFVASSYSRCFCLRAFTSATVAIGRSRRNAAGAKNAWRRK